MKIEFYSVYNLIIIVITNTVYENYLKVQKFKILN
jgi:hypothetical protein